jgi:hypothetical protein
MTFISVKPILKEKKKLFANQDTSNLEMDFASLLFPTVLSIPKMIFLITVTLNAIHVSLVTEMKSMKILLMLLTTFFLQIKLIVSL